MKGNISASKNKAFLAEALGLNNPSIVNITILVAFAISLGWFTDTTLQLLLSVPDDAVPRPSISKLLIGLMPFPSLLLFAFLRWKWAQKAAMRLRAKMKNVQPHEGVIMFLSNLSPDLEKRAKQGDKSLFEEPHFPWMQNKRGLEVHQGCLKKVWLVCSPDSALLVDYFIRFFKAWFPDIEFIQVGGKEGVAFEDLDKLSEVIDDVFQDLPHDIDEVEVVIDITSGTKTATIAGLLASLVSEKREIQYVLEKKFKKEPPSYSVKTYKYAIGFLGKELKRTA